MKTPERDEVETRDPLSIAMYCEAMARHREYYSGPGQAHYQSGGRDAYAAVARLITGLPEPSGHNLDDPLELKKVRAEIHALGHSRGIVPWEDPEAAERAVEPILATCSTCGEERSVYVAEPPEDGYIAICSACSALPIDSDGAEAERLPGEEGLRR